MRPSPSRPARDEHLAAAGPLRRRRPARRQRCRAVPFGGRSAAVRGPCAPLPLRALPGDGRGTGPEGCGLPSRRVRTWAAGGAAPWTGWGPPSRTRWAAGSPAPRTRRTAVSRSGTCAGGSDAGRSAGPGGSYRRWGGAAGGTRGGGDGAGHARRRLPTPRRTPPGRHRTRRPVRAVGPAPGTPAVRTAERPAARRAGAAPKRDGPGVRRKRTRRALRRPAGAGVRPGPPAPARSRPLGQLAEDQAESAGARTQGRGRAGFSPVPVVPRRFGHAVPRDRHPAETRPPYARRDRSRHGPGLREPCAAGVV